jgi:hypothetical protein
MIRHIVLFKLKEFSSESEREEAAANILETFRSLAGQIPQIRNYRVEKDIVGGPASYDIIIDSTFENLEDLKAYKIHPAHQEAVLKNRRWTESRVTGDYEP